MNPTIRTNVPQEIQIDGQSAGPGTPTVTVTDAHGKSRFFLPLRSVLIKSKNSNLPCSLTIIKYMCIFI